MPPTKKSPTKISAARRNAAAELGRRGGRVGGRARAERLTPEQRTEAAQLAAQARWDEQKGVQRAICDGTLSLPVANWIAPSFPEKFASFLNAQSQRPLENFALGAAQETIREGYQFSSQPRTCSRSLRTRFVKR